MSDIPGMNEKTGSQLQQCFGGRLKFLRVSKQLTQEELAERAGLFRTYLSRMESGQANPSLTVLYALAGALDIPVQELFHDVGDAATLPPRVTSARRPSRGRVDR